MWHDLPFDRREEYRKMILAFASLSAAFAQKEDSDEAEIIAPIVNSKFQETVFNKSMGAVAEDIGNTSFDSSLKIIEADGTTKRYLVGIKTFGIRSGFQKIAQFKAISREWSRYINAINQNTGRLQGTQAEKKAQINDRNKENYLCLAHEIAIVRNKRIDSSIAQLKGFRIENNDDTVESVYHVLMPSKKNTPPTISVGETSYSKIDIANIEILGCTNVDKPANFEFTDGKHTYRYTPADSQLLMSFDNQDIVQDTWNVVYADNPYIFFQQLANDIYGEQESVSTVEVEESHSWKISVEKYSGFNSFNGIGLNKKSSTQRKSSIEGLKSRFADILENNILNCIAEKLERLAFETLQADDRELLRAEILAISYDQDEDFINALQKLLYRPVDEMYIPFPDSKRFHLQYPDFFGVGATQLDENNKLVKSKEERKFNLIFEPSGDMIEAYVTQGSGKAIESYEKQSILGEWILRKIFGLKQYEPLTEDKLSEMEINGIRLFRYSGSNDVHLEFIWIDDENLPEDFWA